MTSLESIATSFGYADPQMLVVLLLAAFAGGIVRGFTGFGFAMVFVPIASIAVGPIAAVGLIWFIDLPFAFPLAAGSVRKADWKEVAVLLVGASLMLPVGVYILTQTDPDVMRTAVAVVILIAAIILASGWRYAGRAGVPLSLGVGSVSGLFSGLAQLGGMPLAIFWLGAARNDGAQTKHNLNAYFALSTFVSGAILWANGILSMSLLWQGVPLLVPYGVALLIGAKCFHMASETTFRRLAFTIIFVAALSALPILDGLKKVF